MKLLLLPLLGLPLMAIDPEAVWQAVANALATVLVIGALLGISWKWLGLKAYRAVRDFFKVHREIRLSQIADKEHTDKQFAALAESNQRRFDTIEAVATDTRGQVQILSAEVQRLDTEHQQTREDVAELRGEMRGTLRERERQANFAALAAAEIEREQHRIEEAKENPPS